MTPTLLAAAAVVPYRRRPRGGGQAGATAPARARRLRYPLAGRSAGAAR